MGRRRGAGCSVPGCDGGHVADGMCHYGDGPHSAKGLCDVHYQRVRRAQDQQSLPNFDPSASVKVRCAVCGGPRHPRGLCEPVELTCRECDRPRSRRGLCEVHAPERRPRLGSPAFVEGHVPGNAKLTARAAEDMRRLRDEGYTYRELAEMFGVGVSTVSHVIKGRSWS